MDRHYRAGPAHLRFAEDILQDRDIQIDIGDGQEAPVMRAHHRLHAMQNFGGVILLPLRRDRKARDRARTGGFRRVCGSTVRNGSTQSLQEFDLDLPDRNDV